MRNIMPPVATPDNRFHSGNPQTGQLGSILPAEFMNDTQDSVRDVQSELIAILQSANLDLNPAQNSQLLEALNVLFTPSNETLGALAELSGSENKLPYFTGEKVAALADITAFARKIIGRGNASAVLEDLGLSDVSILQYEGLDNYDGVNGHNNFIALNQLIAAYPNGCRIRLPRTQGGSGHYLFEGSLGVADMSRFVLDPDPGVEATLIGLTSPLLAPGLRFTREFLLHMKNQGYTYHLSPTPLGSVSGKPYVLSAGDGESPLTERVFTHTEFAFNSLNPQTGVQAVFSASTDGEYASFGAIPAGQFVVGSVPVRPGHELHALLTMSNAMSGSFSAYVQTEAGFILICQPKGGGAYTRYTFVEGFNVQTETFADPLPDNPAYRLGSAQVGIKVHSPWSFSLLVNHIEIQRLDQLTSPITRAGWGAGFVTTTDLAYISHPVRIKGNKTYGLRPLSIVTVGDSTADKTNQFSWVNHLVRIASGTGGIQFKNVLNLAVAGQTSVQQAATFNAQDFQALGGFDFALIDVGINDIGGGSSPESFLNAIVSIINKCRANYIVPIVALPGMFYDQSAALPYGQIGQDSANADRGALYRMPLLRKLAELDVQVATTPLANMGAVIPSLLTNTRCDPVVQDNVHQSAWGAELKGMGWAQSLIGYLFSRTRKDISARTVRAAWLPNSSIGVNLKPQYQIIGDEFSLVGGIDTPAGLADNTLIMALPQVYAPKSTIRMPITCQKDNAGVSVWLQSTATLMIYPDGQFVVSGVPSDSRYFWLGTCRYALSS